MSSTIKKKAGLGRGLGALLENANTDITTSNSNANTGNVAMIAISSIEANPWQPRSEFEQTALNELTESIRVHGVIQPITVRKMGYDRYQLISGERRTRASLQAGLTEIPAFIRIANDQDMLEMALIENIQRSDLNAIEVALSYKR
ncbi:MAG: ParB/RepB/Spo0J family partition protein, partial [Bacteroidetes bacterium]|nr:ParB/RepB/Spo0J family partition protein [Bacteroidota bacterium]